VLEGDVPKEVEETLQCVVVLGCPIFSSSPDDIVSLDRLGPAELSKDDVVVPLNNGFPVDVELPQQAQGIGHLALNDSLKKCIQAV